MYCHGPAVFVLCLVAWPLAVIVGWYSGERNQVVLLDSMWAGTIPITTHLVCTDCLDPALYLVGTVTMFIHPERSVDT